MLQKYLEINTGYFFSFVEFATDKLAVAYFPFTSNCAAVVLQQARIDQEPQRCPCVVVRWYSKPKPSWAGILPNLSTVHVSEKWTIANRSDANSTLLEIPKGVNNLLLQSSLDEL